MFESAGPSSTGRRAGDGVRGRCVGAGKCGPLPRRRGVMRGRRADANLISPRNLGPAMAVAIFRGFIAVEVPALPPLQRVQEQLRHSGADIKLVEGGSSHVTLKFLGDTPASFVDKIENAIRNAAKGIKPFEMTVRGAGAFPSSAEPRVVWCGLEHAEPLAVMARRLEDEMHKLAFPRERRDFTPHITLARVRSPRGRERLAAVLAEHAGEAFGKALVGKVLLMRSDLAPKGPTYHTVKSVPLEG
jgi:RNA 2',3'-cyclic 3'-phosphodiesterase